MMYKKGEAVPRSSNFIGETKGQKIKPPFVLEAGIAIRISLFILGLHPYTYCPIFKSYTFRWRSFGAIYTLFTLAWLTGLIVTSFIGLAKLFSASNYHNAQVTDLQVMGVTIVFGCLFNAWLNVLATLSRARQYCDLYNGWLELTVSTSVRPHKGIRVASHVYAVLLMIFVISVLAMGLAGPPDLLIAIVDLLTKVLLLTDEDWTSQDDTTGVKVSASVLKSHIYRFDVATI